MWRSRSTERLVLCLLGHLGRSGARARRQRQRTRANWSRRGAISSGVRRQGPIVEVLRRFVPDMQDLFAQLERQLGEGDVQGSAATLHNQQVLPPLAPAPLAGRASELEQALRRADPRRGMEILAGIPPRRTAHPVRCLPARLQAMFGDVRAESAS